MHRYSIDFGSFNTDYPALSHIRPSASLDTQAQAARDLIGRVVGDRAQYFKVIVVQNKDPSQKDKFNVCISIK